MKKNPCNTGGREILCEGEEKKHKKTQMTNLVFSRLTEIVSVPLCDLSRFVPVFDEQRK